MRRLKGKKEKRTPRPPFLKRSSEEGVDRDDVAGIPKLTLYRINEMGNLIPGACAGSRLCGMCGWWRQNRVQPRYGSCERVWVSKVEGLAFPAIVPQEGAQEGAFHPFTLYGFYCGNHNSQKDKWKTEVENGRQRN